MYDSFVKAVVAKFGGYREKAIIESGFTVEKSETWNTEHKVLNVLAMVEDEDEYTSGFQVDIVTGNICG